MIHEDGIEVCLKRVHNNRQNERLIELEVSAKDDHHGHYKRCLIPTKNAKCQIVVKASSGFCSVDSAAVHVGVGQNSGSKARPSIHSNGELLWRVDSMPYTQKSSNI